MLPLFVLKNAEADAYDLERCDSGTEIPPKPEASSKLFGYWTAEFGTRDKDPTGPTLVRFVQVAGEQEQGQVVRIPEYDDLVILTDSDTRLKNSNQALLAFGKRIFDAAHQQRLSAIRFRDFFVDTSATSDESGKMFTQIRLSSTAVISAPQEGSVDFKRDGISVFHAFHFDHHRLEQSPAAQYLHIGRPPKASDAVFSSNGVVAYDRTTLVTGICLLALSMRDARQAAAGGFDIATLRHNAATFTEVDCIARMAPVVVDIANLLIARYCEARNPCDTNVELMIDVPSWQYFCSLEEGLHEVTCSTSYAMAWLDAVEQRTVQLSSVYEQMVQWEVKRLAVSALEIRHSRSTWESQLVAGIIRDALHAGEVPRIETVLDALTSQGGDAWTRFSAILPTRYRPNSFKALGHLFYVHQFVRPALEEDALDAMHEQRRRRLIIAIDDRAEQKLYSVGQDILKKVRADNTMPWLPTAFELYPMRRTCGGTSGTGHDYLSMSDPSPNSPYTAEVGMQEEEAKRLSPEEYVAQLHGAERAAMMRRFFDEVGLKS